MIGLGSRRVVYDIGNGKVLKLARSQRATNNYLHKDQRYRYSVANKLPLVKHFAALLFYKRVFAAEVIKPLRNTEASKAI